MTIRQQRGTAFDLKLAVGEAAQGRLEEILAAKGDAVEVKTEPKYIRTGNICVEFEQNDGRGGRKPSGIAATKAEWWAIEYLPSRWLVIPVVELRAIARREWRINGAVPMGDNGNLGVLVPLSALIDPWMLSPHEMHVREEAVAA